MSLSHAVPSLSRHLDESAKKPAISGLFASIRNRDGVISRLSLDSRPTFSVSAIFVVPNGVHNISVPTGHTFGTREGV
jgi:hypothetical protein